MSATFSRLGDASVAAGEAFNVSVQLADATGAPGPIEGALTLCIYHPDQSLSPVFEAALAIAGATSTCSVGAADTMACYQAQQQGYPLSWGIWYFDGSGAQWLSLGRFTVKPAPIAMSASASPGLPHAPTLSLTFGLPDQSLALGFAGPRGATAWEGMAATINPATGLPYIAEPTVEAMVAFLAGLLAPANALLLEDGSPLLAEDGSFLLLEA